MPENESETTETIETTPDSGDALRSRLDEIMPDSDAEGADFDENEVDDSDDESVEIDGEEDGDSTEESGSDEQDAGIATDGDDPLAQLPAQWVRDIQTANNMSYAQVQGLAKNYPGAFEKMLGDVAGRGETAKTEAADKEPESDVPTGDDFADILKGLFDEDEIDDEGRLKQVGEKLAAAINPHLKSASEAKKGLDQQASQAEMRQMEQTAEAMFKQLEHGETIYGSGPTAQIKDREQAERRGAAFTVARALQAGLAQTTGETPTFDQAMKLAHQAIAYPHASKAVTKQTSKAVKKQSNSRTHRPGGSGKSGRKPATPADDLRQRVDKIVGK